MPIFTTLGAACAKAWGFTSGLITDQYFNLVSLLLPGNGTNGKQNNAFLDSSGQNGGAGWTITPNGNATQGTFSPFSQTGWGAYFDGSNDSVSVVSDASWALSGVFSVEAWVWNGGTQTNYPGIFATPTNGFVLAFKTDTSQFGVAQSGVAWTSVLATPPTTNTWTHVAVTRDSSNVMRMFYNGVLKASATVTTSFAQGALTIGAQSGSGSLLGYLSNARWIKGSIPTSYQTSSTTIDASIFTPSTSSLTTSSQGATSGDVKLLALQNNRFIDNSSSPFTLTPNNGAAITPFSPFAPTAAYTTAAVGGSGYFDGTLDSLTGPTSNSAFAFGTGAYSVEAWVYLTGFDNGGVNAAFVVDCGGATNAFNMIVNTNGSLALNKYGVGAVITGNSGKIALNSWNHIAICRNSTASNDTRLFVNGALDTTGTDSNDWTVNTTPTFGGAGNLTTLDVIGYLSGIRIIKSQALATSAFTPPTAPVSASTVGWNGSSTAISGTCSLLLNFTNAGITDATAKNVLETVGNAQISTTQSKWGGGSMLFPQSGTTDYLKEPLTDLLKIGSGDYTFECWLYRNNSDDAALYVNRSTAQDGFLFGIRTNKVFMLVSQDGSTWAINTYATTQGNSVPTTTWSHIAISRQGSSWRVFIDGTLSYTSTLSGSVFQNQPFVYVGYDSGVTPLNGYIDDLRVTKGYARYVEGTGGNAGKMVFNGTNTLALPTAPFPVQ